MKMAIASSRQHEMIHEAAVLHVLDEERKLNPNAIGANNLPRQLVHLYGPVVCMSYGGPELSDYQETQVNGIRNGTLTPQKYLTKIQKVGQDLFAGVHFLSHHGRMCHHDMKHFNVAVAEGPDGVPNACLFDFGTTFPCQFIPDEVFGTNAYHPYEVV